MLLSGQEYLEKLTALMRSAPEGRVAVAVSGGGDSVALLLLMDVWAQANGREIAVVTVDHGLRPEAVAEAAYVASLCAEMRLTHQTLKWSGWNGKGNLQNAARMARRELIGGWAKTQGIGTVVTGHTRNDQAETFLMRLARGSGVDGLAGIYQVSEVDNVIWMRPLLDIGREELRGFLRARGIRWIEDPSNEDTRFNRIKIRKGMAALEELGLGVAVLSETAKRMQRARDALEQMTLSLAQDVAEPRESGAVRLQMDAFLSAPIEAQLRLLAHMIGWVSSATYRPRLKSLQRVREGLSNGKPQTLAGCIISIVGKGQIEICREVKAVLPSESIIGLFDGRWIVGCTRGGATLTLRALGENGILLRPEWRQSAESRNTILSMPSIWYNNELMSVPLLDKDGPYTCQLNGGVHSFFSSILTH